jgi:hypothetical protein
LDRGIDWFPFTGDDIRIDVMCGRYADGRPRGWFRILIRPSALRPLGLHPDQPTSRIIGPTPPAWSRAEAMRRFRSQR